MELEGVDRGDAKSVESPEVGPVLSRIEIVQVIFSDCRQTFATWSFPEQEMTEFRVGYPTTSKNKLPTTVASTPTS